MKISNSIFTGESGTAESAGLKDREDQPLLASYPACNSIARRYGWNLESLNLDPEEMLSDKTIMGIKEMLKTHPAKYLIWEAYPAEAIAQRMKDELGLTSIEFSSCELLSDAEIDAGTDYMTVMQRQPPFPPSAPVQQPPFAPLRSGPKAPSRPSRQKQIPSSPRISRPSRKPSVLSLTVHVSSQRTSIQTARPMRESAPAAERSRP